ncbi:uncharacterized protein TNCV_4911801 [Trichonephila clavipes]|nr:uncharacterized protein TNCV_4911801 [Trichonephila clavipes]
MPTAGVKNGRSLQGKLTDGTVFEIEAGASFYTDPSSDPIFPPPDVAAVAEWYRHRIVAGFVTSSSPVPLKTRRVGQRCMLNLSRAEKSSRWCGVVVRRGGASSGVVHVT